ncbi:hypothetical protein [Saccharopolyspora shandongensis]|uniref:hypothetical protein n=1 Tax=Saccharopolyspora shandongensis TaxID=418495 RepID=UPI0033D1078B
MTKTRTGTAGLARAVVGGAPVGAVAAAEIGAAAGPAGLGALLLAVLAVGYRTVARNRPMSTRRAAERAARRSERQAQRRRPSAARSTGILGGSRRTAGHAAAKPKQGKKGQPSAGKSIGGRGTTKPKRFGRKAAAGHSTAATRSTSTRGGALGQALGRIAGGKNRKHGTGQAGASVRAGSRPAGRSSGLGRRLLGKVTGKRPASTSRRPGHGGKTTSAAKRSRKAIKAARKDQRQREAKRRKSAARTISRNKRFQWRRRIAKLGLLRAMWNAGHWAGRKSVAAMFEAWYWTCIAGHRLGNRARALHFDAITALRAPFVGVFADWQRFQQARQARHERELERATGKKTEKTTANPNGFGGTYQEGTQPMIRTNVRDIIESIQNAQRLGRGEQPHAAEVHQWHKDVAELAEALADFLTQDVEVAIETLPPEGAAHDITAAVPDGFKASAEQVAEATYAWEQAQGTKLERLYSDDVRENAWDRSTMPDA